MIIREKHCVCRCPLKSFTNGAGVTPYFSPEFMRKSQEPNQVSGPWYILAVPTGKPEFGAPNCPVRALRYYRRYLTEHPGLRKDRRRLFP